MTHKRRVYLVVVLGAVGDDLPGLARHQVQQLVDQEGGREGVEPRWRDPDQLPTYRTPSHSQTVRLTARYLNPSCLASVATILCNKQLELLTRLSSCPTSRQETHTVWEHGNSFGECSDPSYPPFRNTWTFNMKIFQTDRGRLYR